MGQTQSKDQLLYQLVSCGNIEEIKVLRREGAGLEWIDREGKTPLIVACMMPDGFLIAKTLIELGANVNAYCRGSHAGTPLHHAAKRGLEETVTLLLSHGANALALNDDCHTALDMARAKGHTTVVRAIESYICLFSGWLRELNGPGFLVKLAPNLVSRKIWAVVVPCESRNRRKLPKFELAIYPGPQVARPSTVIPLWKVKIEELDLNHPAPAVAITDKATRVRLRKSRPPRTPQWRERRALGRPFYVSYTGRQFKFLSGNEGDKQQIQWFFNACIGLQQVNFPNVAIPATMPAPTPEDLELAMAISASLQSAVEDRPPVFPDTHLGTEINNTNGWGNSADIASHNGWGPPEGTVRPSKLGSGGWSDNSSSSSHNGWDMPSGPSGNPTQLDHSRNTTPVVALSTQSVPPTTSAIPSAPPVPEEIPDDGPIHYPLIDSRPIDLSMPTVEIKPATSELKEEDGASDLCVICLDASKEGACVPCGHVVGCMSCLNEVKAKDWGCPVCRAKINQVIRIYTV
ncbi:putative E3 ubiquitin-protein ligase XBOS34 [Tasmannia lanceolata]|uniref:putative E3 ubiquitin-protein ligase XBOS34 n=1 Tax=Tasmannia lanceolata TaxID=3420 RepID=UPI004063B476